METAKPTSRKYPPYAKQGPRPQERAELFFLPHFPAMPIAILSGEEPLRKDEQEQGGSGWLCRFVQEFSFHLKKDDRSLFQANHISCTTSQFLTTHFIWVAVALTRWQS